MAKIRISLSDQRTVLKKMFAFLKPDGFRFAVLTLVASSSSLTISYLFSKGIGLIIASVSHNDMAKYSQGLFMLLAALLCVIILFPVAYSLTRIGHRTMGKIRSALFAHMVDLPVGYYADSHSGDLLSRLNNDINSMEAILLTQFRSILSSLIAFAGASILIGLKSWPVLLLAFAIGGLQILLNLVLSQYALHLARIMSQQQAENSKVISNILSGISVIHMFSLATPMNLIFEKVNRAVFHTGMKKGRINVFRQGLTTFTYALSSAGMILLCIFLSSKGFILLEDVMVIGFLAATITNKVGMFGDELVYFQWAVAGAERVQDIMEIPVDVMKRTENAHEESTAASIQEGQAIEIRNVHFGYEKQAVLQNFSLTAQHGEVCAVVGASGGGKSTLMQLLIGFYQPDSGDIRIFGKQYQNYTLETLRGLMAYVPQNNYLFSGTIESNIAFGNPKAGREEIIAAAKAANAHDFIMEMENGYGTAVSERGSSLSGGQRQRIAIARALLKNAPILLLDEATASLDSKAEQEVQEAIETLMKGRTTLVIAHRLSTVQHAHKILVMEHGRIVEEGTHVQLLENNGRYAYYHGLQFQEAS